MSSSRAKASKLLLEIARWLSIWGLWPVKSLSQPLNCLGSKKAARDTGKQTGAAVVRHSLVTERPTGKAGSQAVWSRPPSENALWDDITVTLNIQQGERMEQSREKTKEKSTGSRNNTLLKTSDYLDP